ncbi:MAG TPA: hypothetical protein PK156_10225 [Polyangium sp.]|nr:hypothetical protein [Polyangium sp.]
MSETTARTTEKTSSKPTKSGDAPRKKRKKKAAKPREGIPPFAQHYPHDETLDALLVTFERGNYAAVREGAQKILKSDAKKAVKQAAEDLLRRLEPDPLAHYMLGISVLLLVFFTIWYFTHRLGP